MNTAQNLPAQQNIARNVRCVGGIAAGVQAAGVVAEDGLRGVGAGAHTAHVVVSVLTVPNVWGLRDRTNLRFLSKNDQIGYFKEKLMKDK